MSDTAPIVLLTGASGQLGRVLAPRLYARGWQLRMTDSRPYPDPVPSGASFFTMALEDREAVMEAVSGCDLVLHFGGVSTEQSFEEILGPNLRGLFHVYEAARRHRARVVFPSSVHVVGMYERTERLDQDCLPRPDGFYGLSKAYGEMLARMYWDKHEVESVVIRIGSTLPEPTDRRFLSTWLSHDDFESLIAQCALAERVGFTVIWGASDNSLSFWRADGRARIGWAPRDSSDRFVAAVEGIVSGDHVADALQGGRFITVDYSRDGLPPKDLF